MASRQRLMDLTACKPAARGIGVLAALGVAAAILVAGPAASLAQTDVSGNYRVNGTALDGAPDSGTAALSQMSGPVYTVSW
jgi:hypothetical protein